MVCTGCGTMSYTVKSSVEKQGFKLSNYEKWVLDDNDEENDISGSLIGLMEDYGMHTDYQLYKIKPEKCLKVNLQVDYGWMLPPRSPLGRPVLPVLSPYSLKSVYITFRDGKSNKVLFKFSSIRGLCRGVRDVYNDDDKKYYVYYNDFVMMRFYRALRRYEIIPPYGPKPFVITTDE